jgi:hypothetical protein
MPQKAPLSAPRPAKSCSCRVLGFLRPISQDTIAASCTVMSSFFARDLSVVAARSAPSVVLNRQMVNVATVITSS